MIQASSYYIEQDNNTVNGKKFGYFFNETGLSIDGTEYGQILIANSSNMLVSGGSFDDASVGVSFTLSTNCTLEDATADQNSYIGVELLSSTNSTIKNCSLSNNLLSTIASTLSDSTDYVGNTIYENGFCAFENQILGPIQLNSFDSAINNTITYTYKL